SGECPISLVLTRFHLLLLYRTSVRIVCVLNQRVIHEDHFLAEPCRGVCKDPVRGTIWLYTSRVVYRYKVVQEDRDIWQIYLEKKDLESARQYAGSDVIKLDRTVCEEALHLFSRGE